MSERAKHLAGQAQQSTPEERAALPSILSDIADEQTYEVDPAILVE